VRSTPGNVENGPSRSTSATLARQNKGVQIGVGRMHDDFGRAPATVSSKRAVMVGGRQDAVHGAPIVDDRR